MFNLTGKMHVEVHDLYKGREKIEYVVVTCHCTAFVVSSMDVQQDKLNIAFPSFNHTQITPLQYVKYSLGLYLHFV